MNDISMKHGKRIEENIVSSLRLAGFYLMTGGDLDHNHKIDFAIHINKQLVGVQCSLRKNAVKARAAKICALDVVPRFIYLHVGGGFFTDYKKEYGSELYRIFNWIIKNYSRHQALMLSICRRGLRVDVI